MKILVTGAAGFLGSHIAEAFAMEHEVLGVDNLSAGDWENVPQDINFKVGDCRQQRLMRSLMEGVDVVYHAAAHPHEGLSVFSPHVITNSIYDASVSVFSAAIAAKVKRIVFCSSMSRYGDNPTPFTEDQAPNPKDPYAVAKVASELTLKCLAQAHGVEYVIGVPHNIVGPRQKYDDPFRNVAAIMANRMMSGLQPIVYGDGQQTRCFSDVRDVLSVLTALATDPRVNGQTFNVGPDEQVVTIEELGKTIAEVIGVEWDPMRLPDRPCEVKHAHCSSNKIREWFDYRTRHSLRETVKSLVDHIQKHGAKEFNYYIPLEIVTDKTPKFWTKEVK